MVTPKEEPMWSKSPSPLASGENLGAAWLSRLSTQLPDLPDASGLFHTLLCRDLSIDHRRSRYGHLFGSMVVSNGIANRYSTLHGGAIGSLIEILACCTLQSMNENQQGTVTDINISYISGVPVKEEVDFEVQVLKADNKISVASVDLRNKKSGHITAQGRVTMRFELSAKL